MKENEHPVSSALGTGWMQPDTETDGGQAYGGPLGVPVLSQAHRTRTVVLRNPRELGYHITEGASERERIT